MEFLNMETYRNSINEIDDEHLETEVLSFTESQEEEQELISLKKLKKRNSLN